MNDRPTPEADLMRKSTRNLDDWIEHAERMETERDEAQLDRFYLCKQLTESRAQAERLAEALGFYADASKYPAPLTGGLGSLYYDCGGVAKSTLAAHRAAKGTSL